MYCQSILVVFRYIWWKLFELSWAFGFLRLCIVQVKSYLPRQDWFKKTFDVTDSLISHLWWSLNRSASGNAKKFLQQTAFLRVDLKFCFLRFSASIVRPLLSPPKKLSLCPVQHDVLVRLCWGRQHLFPYLCRIHLFKFFFRNTCWHFEFNSIIL